MTVPGLGVPGVFAIGQFDDVDAVAEGVVLTIGTAVIAGIASADQSQRRVAGGNPFDVRPRHRPGRVLELRALLIPGTVEVGHEVTINEADGTERVLNLYGFTDTELCSDDLVRAILMQDEVTWIEFSHNSQQVRMDKGEPLIDAIKVNAREIRITSSPATVTEAAA